MLRKKTVDLTGTQAFTQFDSIGRSLPDTPYKPATPVCSDPLKLGNVQERWRARGILAQAGRWENQHEGGEWNGAVFSYWEHTTTPGSSASWRRGRKEVQSFLVV